MQSNGGTVTVGKLLVYAFGIVAFIFLFGVFLGACSSLDRTNGGEVAVVRNGGPFDNTSIRETWGPNRNYSIPGLFSEVRKYIAGNQQRFYSISSDPSLGDKGGYDVINVPTQDGKQVALDGTVYFKTAFTDNAGNMSNQQKSLLEQFDNQYGNRTFPDPSGSGSAHVWDGNSGWNDWLDSIFRPVVNNAVRETIGSYLCVDLYSSCSLVQQNGGNINLSQQAGQNNVRNLNRVQDSVNSRLQQDVNGALGGPYLRDIHFKLVDVKLTPQLQRAIEDVQASFAGIAKAKAENTQANYQAQANRKLADSYRNNPELIQLQIAKELRGSNATVILGSPNGLVLPGK